MLSRKGKSQKLFPLVEMEKKSDVPIYLTVSQYMYLWQNMKKVSSKLPIDEALCFMYFSYPKNPMVKDPSRNISMANIMGF